jgi:tetratricopeptide (TPR) repeat protein
MNSANAASRAERDAMSLGRRRAGPIVAGVAFALVLAWILSAACGRYFGRIGQARDARAAAERGRGYLRTGRPDLAFQAVADVRDDAQGAADAIKVAATALIGMREYRGARLALERALKLQPDQHVMLVTLAELNLDLGNGQRGAELLEKATRLRPDDYRIWLTLAKAHHDLDNFPEAIRAYQEVLRLRPDHRNATIELIETLITNGQSDLAAPWINQSLGQYPDDAVVLGLAAHGAFDAKRLDESIALAGRALQRDPDNVQALLARARSRVARTQWRDALPDAERAAAIADNASALQLLWSIEKRLGLDERAAATAARRAQFGERDRLMTELTKKIAQDPDNPQNPWKMGKLALESGQALLARGCFEAALRLDPNYQPARESLASLRAAQPDPSPNPGGGPLQRYTGQRAALDSPPS